MSSQNPPGYVGSKINPPLPYPGNKAKIAPFILEHLPQHETYVEVFGGTAGVLFNKQESRNEVINDADNDLYTFLKVLKQQPVELQDWLRSHPYSEHLFEKWRVKWHEGWRPDDDLTQAGVYFYLRRGSFGSDMGGFRAEANGRRFSPRQYSNAIDRIPQLSSRLSDVLLLNRDFEDVIEKYARSPDTFLYLDPPYRHRLHYYDNSLFDRARFCNVIAQMSGGDIFPDDASPNEWPKWMLSCSRVPLSIQDLPYYTVETDCIHEINSRSGPKEVTEKLVANYDLENCPKFHSQRQASIDSFQD